MLLWWWWFNGDTMRALLNIMSATLLKQCRKHLSSIEQRLMPHSVNVNWQLHSLFNYTFLKISFFPVNLLFWFINLFVYLPRKIFLSWWPWHRKPWQLRFCIKTGQCLPPFWAGWETWRVRVIVPEPHAALQTLHWPQSLTWQSSTKKK